MCKVPGQKIFEEDLYDYESSKKAFGKILACQRAF